MDWKQTNVLITGASGIVGSWLVRELIKKQANIICFIRDWNPQTQLIASGDVMRTAVVNGKLENYSDIDRAINEYQIDTIFHLGAHTIVDSALRNPLACFESNIRGTYNLLEAARRYDSFVKRVIIASSDKAYGSSDILPYTEDMPLQGRHPYDVSKSCTDLLAIAYAHTYNLPITIARCGNIYGGGDLNWSRIVPDTICKLYHKQNPVLRSDGSYIRDYIYVMDVVDAYILLAEKANQPEIRGQAFNFSTESKITVLEITNKIIELMNCKELKPAILDEAKGEIKNQYLDSSKAKKLLGWQPKYSLEQGLKETICWYIEFFERHEK